MVKKLLNKKVNKKGFTLAELLIVVAIIGVLVAISIPIFTSQLQKAKDSTNAANARAAKAAAVSDYLTGAKTTQETYYYDVQNGALVSSPVTTVSNGIYMGYTVKISAGGNTVTAEPSTAGGGGGT